MSVMEHFSQEFWDERYRSREHLWSGRPNPQLIAEAAPLTPARALDVGCGEGADAIWLAQRGWTVTAFDISPVALGRAEDHARQAGDEVAARISWHQIDLFADPPSAPDGPRGPGGSGSGFGEFELVSAQYLHLPPQVREATLQRLGDSVAAGGDLLFVTHDPSDLQVPGLRRPPYPDMFVTAEEIAGRFDPGRWEILVAEARGRPGHHHAEEPERVAHDAVLHVRRR